jgi:hypothetical protein
MEKYDTISSALIDHKYPYLSIQKRLALLRFLDKKHVKKLINITNFVNQFNQATLQQRPYCVFFSNARVLQFVQLLKQLKIIYFYIKIVPNWIKADLVHGEHSFFIKQVTIAYLFPLFKGHIKILSTPTRNISIKVHQLYYLCKDNVRYPIYIIKTSNGLLPHYVALEKKLGGQILCVIK